MSTCAAFIAAVDQLCVGDWSLDSAPGKGAARYGQPIRANSKHSFLHSMRHFLSMSSCGAGGVCSSGHGITWPCPVPSRFRCWSTMTSSPGKAESRVSTTTWVIPIAPTPLLEYLRAPHGLHRLRLQPAQGQCAGGRPWSARRRSAGIWYLEEVPLTADGFIRKPEGVPARDGRTAR
ncbi:hypothetical protein [Pseudomonas sp. GL-B-16]|uniref:hypothetical protein n=1 Tax=Pseudomonas sp. GL-B-16 TaxID=2832373 RepID=UPI0039893F82